VCQGPSTRQSCHSLPCVISGTWQSCQCLPGLGHTANMPSLPCATLLSTRQSLLPRRSLFSNFIYLPCVEYCTRKNNCRVLEIKLMAKLLFAGHCIPWAVCCMLHTANTLPSVNRHLPCALAHGKCPGSRSVHNAKLGWTRSSLEPNTPVASPDIQNPIVNTKNIFLVVLLFF